MIAPYRHTKIHRGLDNGERVCETKRFPTSAKNFSDGAWCMERLHDRPFQDFVAHETHRLIPQFKDDAPKSVMISSDRIGLLESARLQSAHAMFSGHFAVESITTFTVPRASTNLAADLAAGEVLIVHVCIGQTVAHGL